MWKEWIYLRTGRWHERICPNPTLPRKSPILQRYVVWWCHLALDLFSPCLFLRVSMRNVKGNLNIRCSMSQLNVPSLLNLTASLVTQVVKNLPAMQETWVRSLDWEDPWRKTWQPTPVFLPREFHGQRSLMGYSPWGHKESDTTERLTVKTWKRLRWWFGRQLK